MEKNQMNENREFVEKGDHLVRALAMDGKVRLTAVRSIDTVEKAKKLHDLSPMSTVALGRFMTGLQLLSMDLKNEADEITGIIKSDGPIGGMTAVVKQNADVKAYIQNPTLESYVKEGRADKLDVSRAVGNGVLTIIRAQAGAKPYTGSTALISGEIAEDFTYYMAVSEQIPTIMGLGVLVDSSGVKQAGGYLVQVMPGAGEDVISYLEERIAGFPDLSYLMEEGFTPAQILDLLMGDPNIQYLEFKPSKYQCDCSKERMLRAVDSLGIKEIMEIKSEGEGVDVHCEFCNQSHHINIEDLDRLILQRAEKLNFINMDSESEE